MISEKLLEILVCPETKEKVELAPDELVNEINQKIRSGLLKNNDGNVLDEEIDGGLLRIDGKVLYPIRDGIPIMLIHERLSIG